VRSGVERLGVGSGVERSQQDVRTPQGLAPGRFGRSPIEAFSEGKVVRHGED
jgi:hypothetical protein